MTAPRSVELQENVLVLLNHNILVVVSDDDLDGPFLLLRDGLRLDARVDLAVHEVLDESADVLFGQLLALVKGEFLVLDGLLNSEGGPLVGFKVQIARMSAKGFGVDGCEADYALVLFSNRL